jgi:ankyrin repeat protein
MSEKKCRKAANLEQSILRCTRSGNIEEFRVYLKEARNEILSWRHSRSGETCLLLCARYGHIDRLRYLIEECNESFEEWNNDGKRALHEAALGGHFECVKYLIGRNVEIDCLKRADWLVRANLVLIITNY